MSKIKEWFEANFLDGIRYRADKCCRLLFA